MDIRLSFDVMEAARRSDGETGTWEADHLDRVVRRYLRFLELVAEDPNRPVAPTREIDAIWHLHMLAPRAYFEDCQRVFGQILDHDGGFGKGEGELPHLLDVFEDTARRWQEKFGESYVAVSTDDSVKKCWHSCQSRCWHACSNSARVALAK